MQMNVMCAVPVGHRLADKAVVTPQDLDGENMIGWVPIISQGYKEELSSLDNAGSHPRHVIKTHTSHTRYAMVANGLGVSIVEPFAAKIWRNNGVVVRPFASDISYQYVLAYPGGGIRSELMHDFREAALKVAAAYDFGFDG